MIVASALQLASLARVNQAAAQDPPPSAASATAAQPSREPLDWYGWQTLSVDLAGLATGIAIAASVDSAASPYGLVAASWYGLALVGAPAVHYAHGQGGLGLADVALRGLFAPLAGVVGVVSSCIARDDRDRSCGTSGWTAGMLVGLAGAAAFDSLGLGAARRAQMARTPPGHWYGLQVLAVDALGYTLGVFFALREPRSGHERPHVGLSLGIMDYLVGMIGSPIVHFVHGNVGRGFAALGMRLVVAPIGALFGLIGACEATAGANDCDEQGAQWGLFGGTLAVALFDALVLAYEAPDTTGAASSQAAFDFTLGAGSLGLSARW